MRACLPLALVALALCSGCFGGGGESASPQPTTPPAAATPAPVSTLVDPVPTQAALRARPDRALAARLAGGAVALVDLEGRIGIRPARVVFAHGGRLSGLKWTRWGARGAAGTGTMTGVVCDPDCAHGRLIRASALIRLSKPVACPRGRFFDRARVDVVSDDPAADSTSWLAAPC
jgi:hypothetical protein